MSPQLKQLAHLVDLRERDVERLSADLSEQRATRQRYLDNLARLERLYAAGSATAGRAHTQPAREQVLSPALSLNSGGYKQVVMQMADTHRLDLALHESTMRNTQQRVVEAARRHESLDQMLESKRTALGRAIKAREQKRQDDAASQVWLRGRK